MMSYPEDCIKGISNKDAWFEGNEGPVASASLFRFSNDNDRNDSMIEESINWNDDQHAIHFTLNQKCSKFRIFRITIIDYIPRH